MQDPVSALRGLATVSHVQYPASQLCTDTHPSGNIEALGPPASWPGAQIYMPEKIHLDFNPILIRGP